MISVVFHRRKEGRWVIFQCLLSVSASDFLVMYSVSSILFSSVHLHCRVPGGSVLGYQGC